MKNVLLLIAVFITGCAAGYSANALISQQRLQSALASLSPQSLLRLDSGLRDGLHLSQESIDRLMKEYTTARETWLNIVSLEEACFAWQAAFFYAQVEKHGWKAYRPLIEESSAVYLRKWELPRTAPKGTYIHEWDAKARKAIRESIPTELLERNRRPRM
jgi:hypothetical protein